MDQITFSEAEYQTKKRKTRREIFLERMDKLILPVWTFRTEPKLALGRGVLAPSRQPSGHRIAPGHDSQARDQGKYVDAELANRPLVNRVSAHANQPQ